MVAGTVPDSTSRRNSFDALRLIAAFMVLVAHAFVLTGAGAVPRVAGVPLDRLGICVFFAISGYLIAGSWLRSPSSFSYLKNRALRIFPALIVVVMITTFVIGPLATALPLSDYFGDPHTWQYLMNVSLIGHYDLPGVFQSTDHARSAVNGSLWTLGVEFSCYLGLLALLVLLPKLRVIPLAATAVAAGLVALLAPSFPALMPVQPAMQMTAFFFVAAAMRTALPQWFYRPIPAAAAFVIWMITATLFPGSTWPLAWLLLTYSVIGIGAANLPVLKHAGRFGDFSYGLYLWAYPVQQAVIGAFGIDSLAINVLVVSFISLVLAAVSWHLVEKRALALKSYQLPLPPGRSTTTDINGATGAP